MRVLLDGADPARVGREVEVADLPRLYRTPPTWWRATMVATLDGGATGSDGRSGTINNDADHAVFDTVRRWADVVVVGAGTARAEGYSPVERPIVLVSRSGQVPPGLRDAERGQVLLATVGGSPGLADARRLLGPEHVIEAGEHHVDPVGLRRALEERGHRRVLSEGGPSLLADLLAGGVVDELCLTTVPLVLGGDHPRIAHGPELGVRLEPTLLVEHDGTLLGRWQVRRD